MVTKSVQLLFLLILCVQTGHGYTGCTLSAYFEMNMMERFAQSPIVVYGKTEQHRANKVLLDGSYQYVIDAIYEVHCVIRKAEESINEHITITRIAPLDVCSGSKTSNVMKVGDYSIVALRNATGGLYVLDEVMPGTSAIEIAFKPYLFSLSKTCDLQSWHAPNGATTNRCPICGIANFDTNVKALDTTYGAPTNCIISSTTVFTNMTACDLYMEYSVDSVNSQNCIPANYTQSCARLLTRPPTAVCDCNVKKKTKEVGVGQGVVSIPNLVVVLAAMCMSHVLGQF